MTKDFLFFTYSNHYSGELYKRLESKQYSVDLVDETSLHSFKPEHKYRVVVLYLHEHWTIPITNHLIDNYFSDAILIQHDDTDHENVQIWSNKRPDLIMQREYTDATRNSWGSPIEPFHFAWKSIYNSEYQEKLYDVSFIGNITNQRRIPFAYKLRELAEGKLSHLKWYLNITNMGNETPGEFKRVANQSKIGLHYFGNSYDSIRIWELASTKTAIIMPWMRNKSVSDGYMPFKNYHVIRDDFSDLADQILYLLEENRYSDLAQKSFDDYNTNHTPEKCFEYYYRKLVQHGIVKE